MDQPSPPPSHSSFLRTHEKKLFLIVGVFFALAVGMYFINKAIGLEARLQASLVSSGDYALGTERKAYATASGSTIAVTLQAVLPAGQQLQKVQLVLGPWPSSFTDPIFTFTAGITGSSRIGTDHQVLTVNLDGIEGYDFKRLNLGTLSFTVEGDVSSTMINVIPADPVLATNGTMIVSVSDANTATETAFPSSPFFHVGSEEEIEAAASRGLWAWIKEKVRAFIDWIFGWWSPEASLPLSSSKPSATGSGSTAHVKNKPTPTPTPTATATPTAGVDVELRVQPVTSGVATGEVAEGRFMLSNRSKEKATAIRLDLTAAKELRITDVVPRDKCSVSGQNVTCNFSELSAGQTSPVSVAVRTSTTGTFRISGRVRAKETEANIGNNQAEAEISVKQEKKDESKDKEKEGKKEEPTPSASLAASPKSQPSPPAFSTPVPTKKPSRTEKLPRTGPIPLGVALIAAGIGLLVWRK